jgi:hypothetical protein
MSGHFVLKNISVSDQAIAVSAGANRSGLQHSEVGWNTNSRGVLSNALQGRDIGDRAGLPPHRYLQFSYNNANMRDQTSRYLQGQAGLIHSSAPTTWASGTWLRGPRPRGMSTKPMRQCSSNSCMATLSSKSTTLAVGDTIDTFTEALVFSNGHRG